MKHIFLVLLTVFLGSVQVTQAATVIDIVFPVAGEAVYTDDFYDTRSGGRYHYATDIMASKLTPVLAAQGGMVTWAPLIEPYYGYMITIDGDDGYTYNYVHLNNDNPGTDDGNGGAAQAYAPGIRQGTHVVRGQHIGWVGDSGNAEAVGSHLHFEIYAGSTAINSYESLLIAEGNVGSPVSLSAVSLGGLSFDPAGELESVTSISADKELGNGNDGSACETDSLIRTVEASTVYYCGSDGGRYVFQNESTYYSWYENFDEVEFVTPEAMASIPLSGSVTYKPGSVMLKILSSPKVYAIGQGGTLHWIETSEMAEALYGSSWASLVRDIPDGFWGAYKIGDDVTSD